MSEIKDRTLAFIAHQGLKMKEFEALAGLSSGYVTSMRKGYGADKLNNVLSAFPELNREWLLFGEGSMLREPEPVLPAVDASTSALDVSPDVQGLIAELSAQRRLTETALQQMNKLLEVVDRLTASIERLVAPSERVAR